MQSVVSIRPAIDAACCSAGRFWRGRVRPFRSCRRIRQNLRCNRSCFAFQHFVHNHARFAACIGNDLAQRRLNGTQDDLYACVLVGIAGVQVFRAARARNRATPPPATTPSSTAARVACSASSTRSFFSFISTSVAAPTLITATPPASWQRALAVFLCRNRWLRFRFVGGFGNTRFDLGCIAKAVDDGGVFFTDFDAFEPNRPKSLFQRQADFFGNYGAAGQDGDVLQHGFAAVAEARSFNGNGFQDAADVVHDQSRQGFAFYVFSNNQQRTAGFATCSKTGSRSRMLLIFFVEQQIQTGCQCSDLFSASLMK